MIGKLGGVCEPTKFMSESQDFDGFSPCKGNSMYQSRQNLARKSR